MTGSLEFQAYPPPDGPLQCARIPWDSDAMGFPCYELRCGVVCVSGSGSLLASWLSQLQRNAYIEILDEP